MKRLLVILLSAMLSIVIVSAGVVQYHHHHHGSIAVCMCMDLGDKCHHHHSAEEDSTCNESCSDSADSSMCSHSMRLDDVSISKANVLNPNIIDLQLLAIFVSELICSTTETVCENVCKVKRSVALPLLVCRDALTRRGPPYQMI